jgi:hypothetical protein
VFAPEPIRIVSSRPLFYSDGGDPAADRPPHVRSASALAPWKGELLVVQDDANFFAVVSDDGSVRAIDLPRGHGGLRCFDDTRGNKAHKLDLESCVVLPDGRLVAFGSGSTSARERIVVMGEDEVPAIVDAAPLYAALHEVFPGCELNVEGAAIGGDTIRFFQRGNGRTTAGERAPNGTVDLDVRSFLSWLAGGALSPLSPATLHDLGAIDGVPYSFTDGLGLGKAADFAFLAVAEDSPDAVADGAIYGVACGLLRRGRSSVMRRIHDESGAPSRLKLEGLAVGSGGFFSAVADADDPAAPSVLCALELPSQPFSDRPLPAARAGGETA